MRLLSSSIILAACLVFPLYSMGDEHHDHRVSSTVTEKAISASGTVKSIADNHESVRIFHDPIPSLKWPAMNMVFDVADHELIHPFDPGDKINFEFIQKDGKNIIVRIQKQ